MGYFVKKNSELGVFANTWVGFVFMVIVLVVVMQIFEKIKNVCSNGRSTKILCRNKAGVSNGICFCCRKMFFWFGIIIIINAEGGGATISDFRCTFDNAIGISPRLQKI